jgi:hypothetical protein
MLARYARYLRNCQLHEHKIDAHKWQLLLKCIEMWQQGGCKLSTNFQFDNSKLPQLLLDIEKIISNGEVI